LQIGYKYRIVRPHPEGQPSPAAIYEKIPRAKAPVLVLGGDDDPFTFKKLMPFDEVRASQQVALVHTGKGGHVSFLCGWAGRESLIDSIAPEWFELIMKNSAE
jgi:predicted alpha/beta-fold hydrolase